MGVRWDGAIAGEKCVGCLPQLQLVLWQMNALHDEVREQERDVESGVSAVGDLEVEREQAVGVDEEVLRRPVAKDERLTRGQQALDLRKHRLCDLGVRRGSRPMIRIDTALHEWGLILESIAAIRVHCREQLAGAPRRAEIDPACEELVLPVTPSVRCIAHREQELLVVVREDVRHRTGWQDSARALERAPLIDDPRTVERPVGRDTQLRQRLLQHGASAGPFGSQHDIGDAAG